MRAKKAIVPGILVGILTLVGSQPTGDAPHSRSLPPLKSQ